MAKRFGLIGAAGYVAPRHMKAIKETGNSLVAAYDPFDSVGIIDSYFPEADFFVEFERFDRHLDKLRQKSEDSAVEFVSICSPNYLHDAHVRFGLRMGANVICEKPLVLNPWNVQTLQEVESQSEGKVNTILQLRLHPTIQKLREEVLSTDKTYDIELTYVTSRGKWYDFSWKGDKSKSGGVATNIGVHFFDMIHWIFGETKSSVLHYADDKTNAGYLECERARIKWLLSIDSAALPASATEKSLRTFRSIEIDGKELEFSDGFTDLHTRSYEEIIAGRGFPLEANLPAITTVAEIRNAQPAGLVGDYHPGLKRMGK